MSIIFDDSADRLLRSSDLLDKNAAYTWMAWFYPTATTGTRTLFSLNSNDGNYDFIGLISGLTLYIETQDLSASLSTLAAANAWYHITIQRAAGGGSLHLFINGIEDGVGFSDVAGARPAASRMEMGGFESGNANPFQGNIAYIKAWNAALSSAEILAEANSAPAVRTSNLYGEWQTPQGAGRALDTSGNGRDWTEVGTLTDSSNYPFGGGSTIDLDGVSSMAFAPAASLALTKPLSAVSGLAFAPTAALALTKPLSAASALHFALNGSLAGAVFVDTEKRIESVERRMSVRSINRKHNVVSVPRKTNIVSIERDTLI